MSIQTWAVQLLYSTNLEQKLESPLDLFDDPSEQALPTMPGRPIGLELDRENRTSFPRQFRSGIDRALAMHFFANHELLAIELMAWALLRFREAPLSWRRTLIRIIADEQQHFRLYRDRMRTLGLDFGEVPVSSYFWKTLSKIETREAFIAAMTLTFEQANLDHCCYFAGQFDEVDDHVSGDLMRQIHRDEISHVAHGIHWANAGDRLWDWWTTHLPEPLTPTRAKGLCFDRFGRQKAGFDSDYLDRLELFSQSRGRPPDIWVFHPDHEAELSGRNTGNIAKTLERDLGSLLLFVAATDDVVLVQRRPSPSYLRKLADIGIRLPDLVELHESPRYRQVGQIKMWGEDRSILKRVQAWNQIAQQPGQVDPARQKLASKVTAFELFQSRFLFDDPRLIPMEERGQICTSVEEVEAYCTRFPKVIIKAPYSTAGRDRMRHFAPKWVAKVLAREGAVLVQPWWERLVDISIQAHISNQQLYVDGLTRFYTDATGRFLGVELGRPWERLTVDLRRFCAARWMEQALEQSAEAFAEMAIPMGFSGPFGIDAMVVNDNGTFRFHPLLEVNARHTMSRIAWSMRRFLAPGVSGLWRLWRRSDVGQWGFENLEAFQQWIRANSLQQTKAGKWTAGALLTTEWREDTEVGSILVLGELAERLRPKDVHRTMEVFE